LQQQGEGDRDKKYHLMVDGLVKLKNRIYASYSNELKKLILREFHAKPYLGLLGYQNTLIAIKNFYRWLNLKKDVVEFVVRCLDGKQVKTECNHPTSLLQPILIPEWKWEVISMDFIIGLSRTSKQHDSILVVVNMLSKVTHFIALKSTNSASDVAQIFIGWIVRLHGVAKKIISDKDVKFTSKFWKTMFSCLGIELDFSTTYHP